FPNSDQRHHTHTRIFATPRRSAPDLLQQPIQGTQSPAAGGEHLPDRSWYPRPRRETAPTHSRNQSNGSCTIKYAHQDASTRTRSTGGHSPQISRVANSMVARSLVKQSN